MGLFKKQAITPPTPDEPSPELVSFEGCPNKVWRKFENQQPEDVLQVHENEFLAEVRDYKEAEIVCPQYPFGTGEIATAKSTHLDTKYERLTMAKKIGCATCRFKDETMDRIDTQTVNPDGSMRVDVNFIPHTPESLSQ
jgi:hypothetical protein